MNTTTLDMKAFATSEMIAEGKRLRALTEQRIATIDDAHQYASYVVLRDQFCRTNLPAYENTIQLLCDAFLRYADDEIGTPNNGIELGVYIYKCPQRTVWGADVIEALIKWDTLRAKEWT